MLAVTASLVSTGTLSNSTQAMRSPNCCLSSWVSTTSPAGLFVYARSGVTGQLTFIEAHYDGLGGVDGLDGAEHLEVSSDGENVYAASFVDGAIAGVAIGAAMLAENPSVTPVTAHHGGRTLQQALRNGRSD